jgi:RNA polymerase sigma factor for flagellar operon FliA
MEVRVRRRILRDSNQYLKDALEEQRNRVLSRRNELVEANLPVLVHVAERLRTKLPSFVETDELIQAGVPALIQSVERFRPARGNKFATFAVPRLRGAILDALRSADDVPRLARQRNKARVNAMDAFLKTHGRPPSAEELKEALSEQDPAERDKIMAEKPVPTVLSTESVLTSGERSEPLTLSDRLSDDRAVSPLTKAEREDLKRYLIERLSRRDRLIIILYYYENMTMLEVATALGISESRVSQTLKPLLAQIRARVE